MKDAYAFCPFTLFPTRFPRCCFRLAVDVQRDVNALYFHLARDVPFVRSALAGVVASDAFIRRHMALYERVCALADGPRPPVTLQVQRSDYMLNSGAATSSNCALGVCIKQVTPLLVSFITLQIEVNNIASGAASLSAKCTQMHNHVMQKYLRRVKRWDSARVDRFMQQHNRHTPNASLTTVVDGVYAAWKHAADFDALVLFVIEEYTCNFMDQRSVEYELARQPERVDVVRLTLKQCDEL